MRLIGDCLLVFMVSIDVDKVPRYKINNSVSQKHVKHYYWIVMPAKYATNNTVNFLCYMLANYIIATSIGL